MSLVSFMTHLVTAAYSLLSTQRALLMQREELDERELKPEQTVGLRSESIELPPWRAERATGLSVRGIPVETGLSLDISTVEFWQGSATRTPVT